MIYYILKVFYLLVVKSLIVAGIETTSVRVTGAEIAGYV